MAGLDVTKKAEIYHILYVNAGAILDRVTPRQRGDAAEEN
jgi:hypothetical protein